MHEVSVGGGLNIACCIVERLKLGFQANISAVGDENIQASLLILHGQTRPKIKGLAYCLTTASYTRTVAKCGESTDHHLSPCS